MKIEGESKRAELDGDWQAQRVGVICRKKEREIHPYKVIEITPPPKSLGVRCFSSVCPLFLSYKLYKLFPCKCQHIFFFFGCIMFLGKCQYSQLVYIVNEKLLLRECSKVFKN